MTKNLKTFEAAKRALQILETQLATESKPDPRLKRSHKRVKRLLELLAVAESKYEIIHNRRVPTKVTERTAGAAKKAAPKKSAKKAASNVVELHAPKKAAAQARKRGSVKRSK